MSIDPRSQSATQGLQSLIQKAIAPYRAWRAEGRGLSSNRAVIRRDGETEDDGETYARLIPSIPLADQDAAMLKIAGKDIYIGSVFQGDPGAVDLGWVPVGRVYVDGDAQNSADNTSTTNVQPDGNFVNAMSLATDLDNGTYAVLVIGSFLGGHSDDDSVQFRVTAGGSTGATRSKAVPSSQTVRLQAVTNFGGIVVSGGSLTCTIEYRRGDASVGETASAVAPTLAVWATRVA